MSILLGGAGGLAAGIAIAYAMTSGDKAKLEDAAANLLREREKIASLEKELQHEMQKSAGLDAERRLMGEQMRQHKADLDGMEKKFALQFENLANRIFEEKTTRFKQDSAEGLGQLLNPLKEKLQEFHRKVDDSFGQQAKETFSLKEQIQNIASVNEKMTQQTESLTRALKGDVKAQGNWGEMMLEKLLEDSGLRKGIDYTLQGADLGLRHTESGGLLKPDVIVHLPDNKHIIIDAKVSLTSYERYCAAVDDEGRGAALKDFSASIRSHVSGLEKRRYQDSENLGTPDLVLMFMPIEGAYSLAVQKDTELHTDAWNKKIVIVSPVTLFATLRTISTVWQVETQNKKTLDIAKLGGSLVDKVAVFLDYMEDIGKSLGKAQTAYEKASSNLQSGKGNILRTAEKLRELGVKGTKALPASAEAEDEADGVDAPPEGAPPLKVIENG